MLTNDCIIHYPALSVYIFLFAPFFEKPLSICSAHSQIEGRYVKTPEITSSKVCCCQPEINFNYTQTTDKQEEHHLLDEGQISNAFRV